MRRINPILLLLLTAFCLMVPPLARADTITLSGITTSGIWQHGGTTATLRIWASETFTAEDGTIVLGGVAGGSGVYREVACTVNATTKVLTCPSVQLPSTTDSSRPNARYTGVLYDSRGQRRETLFDRWQLPDSLAAQTFLQFETYNRAPTPRLGDAFFTKEQTFAILSQQSTSAVTVAGVQTLTNKTIDGLQNTLTNLNASNLTSGTLPAARLPTEAVTLTGTQTLTNKTIDGLQNTLTNLNASNLTSGTLPAARLPTEAVTLSSTQTLFNKTIDGLQNTLTNLNASNLTQGQLPAARLPAFTGEVTTTAGTVLTSITANNSAFWAGKVTDETGTGVQVFSNAPALASPVINTAATFPFLTSGSVPFITGSGALSQDNSALFWDNTNKRLGVGTTVPTQRLTVAGAILIIDAPANLYMRDATTGLQAASSGVVTPQAGNSIRSTNFTSGVTGWDVNAAGDGEFNNIRIRGELAASVFKVSEVSATAGTQGVFKSASTLAADVTTPSSTGSSFVFSAVNSDAGGMLFAVGDIIWIRTFTGSGISSSWATITARSSTGANTDYAATLQSGSTSATFRAGTAVVDLGPAGTGFITLSADGTVGASPNLTMATHSGTPWNAVDTLTRLGNLNGSYGYATNVYGMGIGQYGVPSQSWLTVDQTNGFRVGNNTTQLAQWDISGNITVGQVAFGQSNVRISSGAVALRNNTTERIRLAADGNVTVGEVTAGQSNVHISDGVVALRNNTTERIRLASDGSGFVANSNIAWDTAGNLTVANNATIAGWSVTPTSFSSGQVVLASGSDPPAGQVTWFGKSALGYQGVYLRDSAGRSLEVLGNNLGIYPYLGIYDATRMRVVIGGLNFAHNPDGSTNSVGMKIWASNGALLSEFSDVQNFIAGWTVNSTAFVKDTGVNNSSAGMSPADYPFFGGATFANRATAPFRVTPDGKVFASDATITGAVTATSGSIAGPLTLSGAGASLAIGTTPPTSSTAGTGLWFDRTGIYGLASNTQQAVFNATTGKITAGAGSVVLDSMGLTLSGGTGQESQIKWTDTSQIIGQLNAHRLSSGIPEVSIGLNSQGWAAEAAGNSSVALNVAHTNASGQMPAILLSKFGSSHATYPNRATIAMEVETGGVVIGNLIDRYVPAPASTALEIRSTTAAVLFPRMTTTQRNALTATDGMVIYNTTTATLQVRASGAWSDLH